MIDSVTRADGNTFALSLNGKSQTYTNDKEGKRQAILDGLSAIETMTVGKDVYLPSSESLQLVAAVLYPDGIQTEAAYRTVCQVTDKACAHLGYGAEVELGPPDVPFARRGPYRRREPAIDGQLVLAELALAGTSSSQPRREATCALIWHKVGQASYGRPWQQLTPAQQQRVRSQVDALAAHAGWQRAAEIDKYTRPLDIDEAAARRRLAAYLAREEGRPLPAGSLIYQLQMGAYGRGFYSNELAPALQALVGEVLRAHGYQPAPEDGKYYPLPLTLTPEAAASMAEKLAALTPVRTDFGPGLLWRDVLAAVVGRDQTVSEWQAQQLLQDGHVSRLLRQLGYQTALTWCQLLRPGDDGAVQVLLKEVRVQNDPRRKLSLARGFAVYAPAVVIDDLDDTLVYLEMVGVKEAVRANWAALVGGGKVHWLGRKRIRLEGMKHHVKVQTGLPCGWRDQILIHKQACPEQGRRASLQAMNPEQPFYLLDDGTQPIPPLFYPMLNKCLALPLLPEWAEYLWLSGREQKLITLLNDGEGQGYAAWRVLPATDEWQTVIENGLSGRVLSF